MKRGDEWIDCRGFPELVPYVIKSLETNTSITHLDLSRCAITDDTLKQFHFETNTSIKTLILSENRIGPEGAEYFKKVLTCNTTLVCLNLSNNFYMGSIGLLAIMEALGKNKTLKRLNLARGDRPRERLLVPINPPDLHTLYNHTDWAHAFFQMLETNTSLEWINLKGQEFSSDPIKQSNNVSVLSLKLSKYHSKNTKRFSRRNRAIDAEIQKQEKKSRLFWWACIQQTRDVVDLQDEFSNIVDLLIKGKVDCMIKKLSVSTQTNRPDL